EDTEDLMQDTFVDAYKGLSKFEGRSQFKTWIIRLMLNNCYRRSKKSSFKNEFAREINPNSNPMFSQSKDKTTRKLQNSELKHILDDALLELQHPYRMVFSLHEINGLSTKETAELMAISESNVKVRLKRSKEKLKDELEKYYTKTELFEFNLI